MRKLVSRDTAQKSLGQKGFKVDSSKDHVFFFHEINGKETGIRTKISHTKSFKEITGDILGMMTRQLKLNTSQQTFEFLDCKMSATEYNAIAMENLRK